MKNGMLFWLSILCYGIVAVAGIGGGIWVIYRVLKTGVLH